MEGGVVRFANFIEPVGCVTVGILLRRMEYGGKKGRSASRRMKARAAEGRRGTGIYIVWASKSERRRARGSRSKP